MLVDGVLYGLVIGGVIVAVFVLAGGRLATPRQRAMNLLVIVAFWVFYVISQGVGLDQFWAFVIAFSVMLIVMGALRVVRSARTSPAGRTT